MRRLIVRPGKRQPSSWIDGKAKSAEETVRNGAARCRRSVGGRVTKERAALVALLRLEVREGRHLLICAASGSELARYLRRHSASDH
jgi:hypothetical protein